MVPEWFDAGMCQHVYFEVGFVLEGPATLCASDPRRMSHVAVIDVPFGVGHFWMSLFPVAEGSLPRGQNFVAEWTGKLYQAFRLI